jgi:hypothetical protein
MTTKLTLTIEEDIIKLAKKYAADKGRSLSDLIENYLKNLVMKETKEEFSPKVKKLMGSVSAPADFDYKKALSDAIAKKHLHK